MTEIAELEGRITSALDRIARAIEQDRDGAADDAARLAAERAAREAAEARVAEVEAAASAVRDEAMGAAEAARREMADALDAAQDEAARLRLANDALRDSNRALREALGQGGAEEGLVADALRAELDALRVVREADRAELDAILASLAPILGEAAHA